MRTVREIAAELAASGLTAEQMSLVTELAMSAMGLSQSKHAQAQARYSARKKERSALISNDQHDQNDQNDQQTTPPPSSSSSLPSPLPPITPISLTLTPPPSSSPPLLDGRKPTRPERDKKFEEFKAAYPKRKGGNPWKPAQAVFDRAILAGTDPDQIISALRSGIGYDREKLGTEYIPQAVKWLRDERWRDHVASKPIDHRPAYLTPPPGFKSYEETLAELGIGTESHEQNTATEFLGNPGLGKDRTH